MNSINQIIGGLFPPRQPKEDEYINESDGLIYCAKCRTPRQCMIHHGDRIITPPIMCDCQRISEEREEAAFQKRQAEFRIERMKASGLQDRYLHDYTFTNDKGYNPEISKAREYVAQWNEMKKNCIGLLMWGDVGTGKTFLAACIANALIEEGKAAVRVLPCHEIWHGITYQEDLPDVIAYIASLRERGIYPETLLD